MPFTRLPGLLLLALAISACADSPLAPTAPPVVARLDITPATPALVRGTELQLHALPQTAEGTPLQDRSVTFTSLTPTIASVTTAGLVQGLAEGKATVRVTSDGFSRDVDLSVLAAPLTALVPSINAAVLEESGATDVAVAGRNAFGEHVEDLALTWTSLSPAVATVLDGRITAVGEGQATIRASIGDLSADVSVTVRPTFGGHLLFSMDDGAFGARRIYRSTQADYATAQRLMDLNGMSNPEFSPDRQRLLFVCPNDGDAICVSKADGTDIVTLTSGDRFYEDQPTWSPDGSKIAFRRWSVIGTPGPWNPTDIWVMNADGTGQVNLTADATSQHWPTWTAARGGQIAFVQDARVDGYETSRIAVMSPTGAAREPISAAGMSVAERPRWSPDGSALLYTKTGDGSNGQIRHLTVATGADRAFLAASLPGGVQAHPTFSPNGRYVVFSSTHEDVGGVIAAQIYTARVDGTDVRRRSAGGFAKADFAWYATP